MAFIYIISCGVLHTRAVRLSVHAMHRKLNCKLEGLGKVGLRLIEVNMRCNTYHLLVLLVTQSMF